MVKWSVDVLEICVVRDSFYVACGANTGPIFRNTRRLIHSFGFVPVLARCSDKKLITISIENFAFGNRRSYHTKFLLHLAVRPKIV